MKKENIITEENKELFLKMVKAGIFLELDSITNSEILDNLLNYEINNFLQLSRNSTKKMLINLLDLKEWSTKEDIINEINQIL